MSKYLSVLFLAFFITGCGFEIVNTGFRGVQTRFGKVEGGTLDEGLHFYNPFTTSIVELDVRVQRLDRKTIAYTKDVQNVTVQYTLNFYPDKTTMHDLYQNVGLDWAEKLIPQLVEGTTKEVVGKYDAVRLIDTRDQAVFQIKELVSKRLFEMPISKVPLIC